MARQLALFAQVTKKTNQASLSTMAFPSRHYLKPQSSLSDARQLPNTSEAALTRPNTVQPSPVPLMASKN